MVLFSFAQEDSLGIEPIDTNHYYSGFFIQAQSSPYFSNNFYARTKTGDYQDPIDIENMYNEYSGYTVGMSFGYTSKDWLVLTGLQFSKRASEFNVTEQKQLIVSQDTTDLNLETHFVNRYHQLNIPISFGYVNYLGHIELVIKAGLSLGLNVINDGYTYNFEDKEVILLKENAAPIIVSYMLSANIKYLINNRLRIFAEPYYISGINSIWKNSPIYAWKQIHYGCSFGVEYLLMKNEKSPNVLN